MNQEVLIKGEDISVFKYYAMTWVDSGEWLALRFGCFTLGKRASGTRWIGGWVEPRAGLEKKFPVPVRD
jgi:hypothetical protein